MKNLKKVVWFHYNKPYSRKYGVDKWTVHWQGSCHIVDQIHCYIPTFSKNRKTQPKVVMRGMASEVLIEDGIITIR